MWSKITQTLTLSLVLCQAAYAEDVGKFTLLPKGATVLFEATCFDNVATARLLTWKEFQEREMREELDFVLNFQIEIHKHEIGNIKIEMEESTFRYEESLKLRDEEIESLRNIVKKDRKINLPLVIAGSIATGVAIGVGGTYAIDKAIN
jgi:hypothetical protein